jgi:regulator of replication initiation timing
VPYEHILKLVDEKLREYEQIIEDYKKALVVNSETIAELQIENTELKMRIAELEDDF